MLQRVSPTSECRRLCEGTNPTTPEIMQGILQTVEAEALRGRPCTCCVQTKGPSPHGTAAEQGSFV
jgi:hypothetical protein